jgi:alpha-beta hydrolase superfamily lysophospholipase
MSATSPVQSTFSVSPSHKSGQGLMRWQPWTGGDWTQMGVIYGMGHGLVAPYYAFSPLNAWAAEWVRDTAQPWVIPDTPYNSWGNDDAIDSVDKSLGWLGAVDGQRCRDDKVFLAGASMGTLTTLNWARQHLDKVAAVALCVPAVSLADLHDRNVQGWKTEIETAYGGAAAYTAAVPTHDPLTYASELVGLPIKLWYSPDDPVIAPAKVEAFAAAVGAELVANPAGTGHDVMAAPAADVTAWFTAHTPARPEPYLGGLVGGVSFAADRFGIHAGAPYVDSAGPAAGEAAALGWVDGPVLVH